MSETPPPAAAPAPSRPLPLESEDRQWASFAHLGGILSFLPSLIIWLVFKDRGSFTNVEAKEALNFQITIAIAYVALAILSGILTVVTFGIFGIISPFLFLALWVLSLIFCIQGFLKAKDGVHYRYPFAIRLIK